MNYSERMIILPARRIISLTKRSIVYSILLMPFFEPLIVDGLLERYPEQWVWLLIDYSFKISELVIAGYVYFLALYKIIWKQKIVDEIDILLILHLVFMIVSCLLKMNFAITFFGSTFCTIALILLSEYMLRKSKADFLQAGKILFGFWSFYAIITAFLFPNGFVASTTKYDAIFGLGSKNNAFPFLFAYLFFSFADRIKTNKHLSFQVPLIIFCMVAAALIYTSMNTLICIVIVFGVYLLEKSKRSFFKKQKVFLWLIVFALFISMIYVGVNIRIIEIILAKLGRNGTFSHRDVIWSHAISYFKNNFFWGAGANIEYRTVWSSIKTHQAHSQYLDKLAKFGIVPFIFLMVSIIKLFRRTGQCDNVYQINLLATMVLIYMFHMAFDTYNYNFYIIFLVILNDFVRQNFRVQKKKDG